MHRTLRAAWLMAALLALASVSVAHAQSVNDGCAAPHRIVWPADHPVWSLCWIAPDSSSGVDGSGIELRDVFYKGKLVLLSLIHISEPTRRTPISYAVFCLKKKKK